MYLLESLFSLRLSLHGRNLSGLIVKSDQNLSIDFVLYHVNILVSEKQLCVSKIGNVNNSNFDW